MKNLKEVLQKFRIWILAIAVMMILMQIMFFVTINDLTILIITVLLIMGVYLNNLNESTLIKIGLILIILCPFLLVFKQNLTAEKVAIWAYIFLFLGLAKKLVVFLKQNGQNKKNI